jgi:hypothetical protein
LKINEELWLVEICIISSVRNKLRKMCETGWVGFLGNRKKIFVHSAIPYLDILKTEFKEFPEYCKYLRLLQRKKILCLLVHKKKSMPERSRPASLWSGSQHTLDQIDPDSTRTIKNE